MTSLPFLYNDFHGGLNTRDSPFLLTDDQARDLQNVQGTTAGAIVKRPGLVTLANTGGNIIASLFAYQNTPAAGDGYLIAVAGPQIFSIDRAGTVFQIGTTTQDYTWNWVQTQSVAGSGPVYGMNGVDAPQQWDGVGNHSTTAWVATTGTVPNGKYMILAGNRLWVAGVAATPNRVFFSDLIPANNGPVTWPTANVAIFDENDGQPITGLGHVGPYILVTKARKLYVITDMNTGDGRRLSDSIGCASHRSIAEAPEGTYFLAEERGVYLTNGSSLKPISDVVQPTLDTMKDRTVSCGTYYNGHYYLSQYMASPGQTLAPTTLDYDSALQSWWLHTFGSNQFVTWHTTAGGVTTPSLYSAKVAVSFAPIVDQCFVPGITTDNGTPFTWRWRGPWQSPTFYRRRRFPTPYFRKRWRQIRFEGAGTVDVSIASDFFGAEVLWQSNLFTPTSTTFGGTGSFGVDGIFGDTPTIGSQRIFSIGVHRAISVVFSATSTTQDSLYEYTMMISDRKDMVTS